MDDLPALPILEVSSLLNFLSLTHIYDLPEELIVNILSRLYSDHLARSRVVSKTFSNISPKVRSVNLLCSLDRYTNSGRRPTPFKDIVTDLILGMRDVNSISIGVEEPVNHMSLEIKLDDLYLTELKFVDRWLKRVCGGLTSLSISDYRMHSRRKWSGVLSLISFHCKNLHELVLKNAWLSTKGLVDEMPMLTSLTLAFVKLDDEDLVKVKSCCPSLQILNLIMVEGLKNPQIDLLRLRTCQYVGSSIATTTPLQVICVPNLTSIKVRMGPWILQRKKKSRNPYSEKNTYFRIPIKNDLNSISKRSFLNDPILLQKKLILVPMQVWSNSKTRAQEAWARAQEACALGTQKSPGCTQILLKFEFE